MGDEVILQVEKLLSMCSEKCEHLTVAIPTPQLFPKFEDDVLYVNNASRLRNFLRERGVHCVDASELYGKIVTFDDEHFRTGSEQNFPSRENQLSPSSVIMGTDEHPASIR